MSNSIKEEILEFELNSEEKYLKEYQKSVSDPQGFWAEKSSPFLWKKKFEKVLEWNFDAPVNRWFIGGKLNITENCLDRHLEKNGNKIAFTWEPNNPSEKTVTISYNELHARVCRFANVLVNNGVKKGDRVCIYLPMIPELPVAMLACARIGAIHSVVYAGFSSGSLANRIQDAKAKIVITSDGAYRGAKLIPMKEITDKALVNCSEVEKLIIVKRVGEKIALVTPRDVWWHDEIAKASEFFAPAEMDAEDPLFILYTSGSTGKPKGIVHSCAAYMVYVDYTFRNIFQCQENDIYWCTADIGWITGHSYFVYGPLLSGISSVMFEGIPTYPDAGRWWDLIDKNKVNIFYTSPTAIRTLEALGLDYVKKYKLDSLKLLGTVGEPINEAAWNWYHKNIGKEKCFIVDTWWQTETGGIAISPIPTFTKQKPGFAMLPLPGIQPVIVNDKGEELKGNNVEGNLCIKFPWPGMLKTVYGDNERFKKTYFGDYPGLYFSGDGCKRDNDGHYRITGRVDDVVKVSGHLIGTAEVENAINQHPAIVESAIAGFPHPIKGNAICAFVVTYNEPENAEKLKQEIIEQVRKIVGPIAKPEKIIFVKGLPKTRSGKIMRRILRKILEGEKQNFGDTSTLLDQEIIKEILASVSPVTI